MYSPRCRVPLSLRAGASLLLLSLLGETPLRAESASVRLPDGWTGDATRVEFKGFGGFNRGEFYAPGYRGEFERTESRLGIFDPLYVKNRAKGAFTLQGEGSDADISARCRMVRKTASVDIVTLDVKKMSYVCEFSGPVAAADWTFVIGEPRRKGLKEQFMAYERRIGAASINGRDLAIRSLHEYQGSPLDSQVPLGYAIESGDALVAAVDLLDWNPIVYLCNDLTAVERESAVVVALALAVLRDPANSALEE